MKRIFGALILIVLSNVSTVASEGYCQQACANLIKIGTYIEGIDNVPMIGKLTNLLPFALIAAGLKECPLQTALVVVGVLTYVASQNDIVRSKLQKYDIMNGLRVKNNHSGVEEELLFVFDYTDEDDEQEDDLEYNQLSHKTIFE